MSETDRVIRLIVKLPVESQRRVWVMVNVLRDLLIASEDGEAELAFTLVMAELADDGFTLETACVECGGSGLTMQPGMPDGEPEGLPCSKCKSKQFAPIGNGTICSNCTKTIGYHYQTAAGVLWCKVPTSDREGQR